MNLSGIRPVEFKVLIKPDEVEEKTAGGIIIPDETKDREQHAQMAGTLIEVSPLAFTYEAWPEGSGPPEPGNRVLFAKYAGFSRTGKDGVEYRVVSDKDITCILD